MMELLEVAGGSAALYILIIFCLRLLGKKGLAEMSLGDLVLIILIGEAIGSLIPQENAFLSAVICVLTLALMNFIIERIVYKSKFLRKFLEGSPVVIVKNGRVMRSRMKEEKLTQDELDEALRNKGVKDIKKVEEAVLETDGGISIVEK
ncbi:MAG TPA: YetF domain-containing protein [Ignavibacteria bacterium]|nr:YetF domain-containing protein [Ignavibacteria bacterium]